MSGGQENAGLEAFYDTVLPNELRAVVKPYGGKVVKASDIADYPGEYTKVEITPPMVEQLFAKGIPKFSDPRREASNRADPKDDEAYAKQMATVTMAVMFYFIGKAFKFLTSKEN